MVGPPGALVLYSAVRYVLANNLPGAFVECGVFRGGLCGMMGEMLAGTDRHIYLFDTFSGMSEPTEEDTRVRNGRAAMETFRARSSWCNGPLDVVKATMARSGFPEHRTHYVVGKVEDTLPQFDSPPIAVLRLDTDWYESTKAELEFLFDHVVTGGLVIVDDYSAWTGSRKAVDEFITARGLHPLMHYEPGVGGISFIKT